MQLRWPGSRGPLDVNTWGQINRRNCGRGGLWPVHYLWLDVLRCHSRDLVVVGVGNVLLLLVLLRVMVKLLLLLLLRVVLLVLRMMLLLLLVLSVEHACNNLGVEGGGQD